MEVKGRVFGTQPVIKFLMLAESFRRRMAVYKKKKKSLNIFTALFGNLMDRDVLDLTHHLVIITFKYSGWS